MPNPWFRLYADILDDAKLISLAFEDQRHFIAVLALKCSGILDQGCAPDLMDRIVAQRIWVDQSAIREVKRRLVDAGLIGDDWQPKAWDKRQFASDHDPTRNERQQRYRERQKQKNQGDNSNALCNATVTTLDTDTDTDTDTEISVISIREDIAEREGVKGESTQPTPPPPATSSRPPGHGTAARGARLATLGLDCLPENWKDFCRSERPDLDPERIYARFTDHWNAQPGQRGVKLDWLATWRNWVRNERREKGNGRTESQLERRAEINAEWRRIGQRAYDEMVGSAP
jgi:hypothetical protein